MNLFYKPFEFIKNNELRALFHLENRNFKKAEELLLKNITSKTNSCLTYNLLIRAYNETKNFQLLIRTLNSAIKNTCNKSLYRKLKKEIIINRFSSLINTV